MNNYTGNRPLSTINKGGLNEDVILEQDQFNSSFLSITFIEPDIVNFLFAADLSQAETDLLDQILIDHDKQFWDEYDVEQANYPGGNADEIFYDSSSSNTGIESNSVQGAITDVDDAVPIVLEDLTNVDPVGGTNGTNGTPNINSFSVKTTPNPFSTFNLVRDVDGIWSTTTPKESPVAIGNIIEFDENYLLSSANKNDVLTFIGSTAILTLPEIFGFDINYTVTINNNGTGILLLRTTDRFVNTSRRRDGVLTDSNRSYLLQPNANVIIKIESTGWGVISETAYAVERVRGLEISLGFLASNVIDKNVSGETIIDPYFANNWITTVTANTVFNIRISQNPDNLTYIDFSLTIKQDAIGAHNITFFEDLNLRWNHNQSVQVPRFPNGIVKIEFSSYDGGVSWIAFEVFRVDSDITTTSLSDTDTNRWIIKQTESRIGLAVLSNAYIETATLSYKFLASANFSTSAEINVYVNNTNVHTYITPNFFEDTIITEDVEVTQLWNINPSDEIYITVKETSGNTSVQIDVKGDLQESLLKISNVVEEVIPEGTDGTSGQIPEISYRAEDTNLRIIDSVDTNVGLNILSRAVLENGFLSFILLSSANFATSNEVKVTVDGIIKYSETFTGIFNNTELLRTNIPIDSSWNILPNSIISLTCRETSGNPSVILNVLGNVQPSVLQIDGLGIEVPEGTNGEGTDGTSGTPHFPSIPDLEDFDDQEHVLTIDDSEIGLEIISSVNIFEADLAFSFLVGSTFSSSCEAKVKIDDIQVYAETIPVPAVDTEFARSMPIEPSWGVNENSRIIITAREVSGAAVDMKVKGNVQLSTLSIANINGGIIEGTDGTSGEIPEGTDGTSGTSGVIPPLGTDGTSGLLSIIDTDDQEHALVITDSEIGLEIISPLNIETANIRFSFLVGSAISSSCEVKLKIDGLQVFGETIPNIFADTEIARFGLFDPVWIIRKDSRLTITARETSGAAVNMLVKGNVQLSTFAITDIVEAPLGTDGTAGEPPKTDPCVGVTVWNAGDHWTTYAVGDLRLDEGGLYELHTQAWAQQKPSTDAAGSSLGWTFIQMCP